MDRQVWEGTENGSWVSLMTRLSHLEVLPLPLPSLSPLFQSIQTPCLDPTAPHPPQGFCITVLVPGMPVPWQLIQSLLLTVVCSETPNRPPERETPLPLLYHRSFSTC